MLKFLLVAVVLSLAVPASAQELPKFDAPLPAKAQILKMRYGGFVTWADKHAKPAMNEAQQDALADWYARIRNQATQPMLAGKAPLVKAMKAVMQWNQDYYEALLEYNRGGTMYAHAANRSVGELADVQADAAASWKTVPKVLANMAAAKSFRANHAQIPDYIDDKAAYDKAMKKEAASLERAKAAINALPLGPRWVVGEYVIQLSKMNWGEEK